ncbi:hypothetical protein H0H93_012246 [Arthromyces matolae]|nr:hypothetical protein H0H93_012246 [Arthromyces matolae]
MLGRSIILAIIEKRKPELLKTFKCSEVWVGQFFESVLSWTVRHGTRAAAHIPDNAPELCERALFRIFHLILFYDIPLKLLINMDQTGILILLSHLRTYEKKGARQVDIVGKDEKRAYTLCVATTADGDILPFQQIWTGKTQASLPSPKAPGYNEALKLGIQFTTANSPKTTSHFSTFKTMKEWMAKILAAYIKAVVEADDLPQNQKAILFIDCYPVHIGQDFRFHVLKEYPNIFLLFVPANSERVSLQLLSGTGIFQPADVGIHTAGVVERFCRNTN